MYVNTGEISRIWPTLTFTSSVKLYLIFKNLFYFITVQRNVLPEFHTYHPGTVGISHGQDLLGLLHHQGSC